MSMQYLYVSLFGVCFGLLGVAVQEKHVLSMLLMLEVSQMSLFILLLSVSWGSVSCYSALIFITLTACEASLGLAVLVSLMRSHGNNKVKSLSSHMC